ncbi:MAG TPA: hypothetical protein VFQ61_27200 [Polyangiaceae bacterium]|nr:hypothetical protein [Polyangiaceae bacterium]
MVAIAREYRVSRLIRWLWCGASLALAGCREQDSALSGDELGSSVLLGTTVVESAAGLPACNLVRRGGVFYARAENALYYCDGRAFHALDLNGRPGEDGRGWAVAVRDAAAECVSGGVVVSAGPDANGDGALDEVASTSAVCDGTAGASPPPLLRSRLLAPGPECPGGGHWVEFGTDVNGNLSLDDDEVSSAEAFCEPQNLWRGDVVVDGDGELEALRGFTEMIGNLTVTGDVTNLGPLESLTRVHGRLQINESRVLNLRGLAALEQVDGDLVVDGNLSLLNLQGLASLAVVTGRFRVSQNWSLESLAGVESLQQVGNLYVESNNGVDTTALGNLTRVDGDISLEGANMRGLRGMTRVNGSLSVSVAGVSDLEGLESLLEVGGSLYISGSSLLNLKGLSRLKRVGGTLWVAAKHIQSLEGAESLTAIGGNLEIPSLSPEIMTVRGLDGLQTIGGSLQLYSAIRDLSGFGSLESIGADAVLDGNALVNLHGLERLTNVGGSFVIQNAGLLQSTAGAGALREIGRDLRIYNNGSIRDLRGFFGLERVAGSLIINFNPSLPACEAEWLRDLVLGRRGVGADIAIFNNSQESCP